MLQAHPRILPELSYGFSTLGQQAQCLDSGIIAVKFHWLQNGLAVTKSAGHTASDFHDMLQTTSENRACRAMFNSGPSWQLIQQCCSQWTDTQTLVALGSISTWCPGGDSQRSACGPRVEGVLSNMGRIWEDHQDFMGIYQGTSRNLFLDPEIWCVTSSFSQRMSETPFAKSFGNKISNIE